MWWRSGEYLRSFLAFGLFAVRLFQAVIYNELLCVFAVLEVFFYIYLVLQDFHIFAKHFTFYTFCRREICILKLNCIDYNMLMDSPIICIYCTLCGVIRPAGCESFSEQFTYLFISHSFPIQLQLSGFLYHTVQSA
jgi:hypothetical protein